MRRRGSSCSRSCSPGHKEVKLDPENRTSVKNWTRSFYLISWCRKQPGDARSRTCARRDRRTESGAGLPESPSLEAPAGPSVELGPDEPAPDAALRGPADLETHLESRILLKVSCFFLFKSINQSINPSQLFSGYIVNLLKVGLNIFI